jgi:hypothetical protein
MPRTQFTMQRMMITIAVVSLFLAILVHRERRIRQLDLMVRNQDITMWSAKANLENAVLAREAVEHFLDKYLDEQGRPRAKDLRSEMSQATMTAGRSSLLPNVISVQ